MHLHTPCEGTATEGTGFYTAELAECIVKALLVAVPLPVVPAAVESVKVDKEVGGFLLQIKWVTSWKKMVKHMKPK